MRPLKLNILKTPHWHRHALTWMLVAGASFLAGNAWLVNRHLGPPG